MKFEVVDVKRRKAAEELSGMFGFTCEKGGVKVYAEEGTEFICAFRDGAFYIKTQKPVQFFLALKILSDEYSAALPAEGYERKLECSFTDLCYMADCSRNAVLKVETLKELVRHLAVLGYDSLGLYLEDTYVVKNQPYFGYLRTPYTEADIHEIDEYCRLFGIELVPYIQTLAHFNTLIRHYAMADMFDFNDILMVGEERTYAFLEDLISTCAKYFSSRNINIGMDEAYMLGRGKYMDVHGARSRYEIMSEHLKRVCEICKKYGYEKPAMWSDMFFSLTMSAQYGGKLPKNVVESVPKNVELVYWDYCSTDKKHYAELIEKHRAFPNEIGFAGGSRKWGGYTPDNRYANASCGAAARACVKKGVRHYILTGWGDNGADCSTFAIFPILLYCARMNYGNFKIDKAYKEAFETLTGMPYAQYLAIDLCNRVTNHDDVEETNSANKYLLFNDVLLGTLDTTLDDGTNELFFEHTNALYRARKKAGKWEYIFDTQYKLSRVLEIKTELGIKLRRAYQSGDKATLEALVKDMKKLLIRIEEFYRALRVQWDKENRANGFDVQDIRIGALKQRVQVAIDKVTDYLKGRADSVPELAEKLLDFMGHGGEFEKDYDQCEWRWTRMTSVNTNF